MRPLSTEEAYLKLALEVVGGIFEVVVLDVGHVEEDGQVMGVVGPPDVEADQSEVVPTQAGTGNDPGEPEQKKEDAC